MDSIPSVIDHDQGSLGLILGSLIMTGTGSANLKNLTKFKKITNSIIFRLQIIAFSWSAQNPFRNWIIHIWFIT